MKNTAFALLITLLIGSAIFWTGCREVGEQANRLIQGEKYGRRNKISLPETSQFAEMMPELIEADKLCILSVADDGSISLNDENVAIKNLPDKISEKLKQLNNDKPAVYLEAAASVKYETVTQILTAARQAKVENAGLIVLKTSSNKLKDDDYGFWVKLAKFDLKSLPAKKSVILEEPIVLSNAQFKIETARIAPDPLILFVEANKNGNLTINNREIGFLPDTQRLTAILADIMKLREENGVYREGTNEIAKYVWTEASRSLSYVDVIKVVDAVKGGSGQPIFLQLDDLPLKD